MCLVSYKLTKFTILLLLKTLYETTSEEDDDGGDDERENKSGLLDLEDLGPMMNTMKQAKVKEIVRQKYSWSLHCRIEIYMS